MLHPRRKWQDEVVVAAQKILILEGKDHLYIQAPTASGKSRAMFEIIEHVPVIGEHRIIVGRGAIVSQHIDSFIQEFSCVKIDDTTVKTPSGKIVQIDTFQSLTVKAKKNIRINPTGYLFFDECHLGGSGEDVLSIPIIFSHYAPAKKCYVSATTLTVNQKMLGNKAKHTYVYTMSEAMDDGILHPVDLVEIHTGTNAKIARLNNSLKAHGSNIQKLDEIYESDCEDMVDRLTKKKVGFDTSIFDVYKEVSNLRGESAMCVYLTKHFGEQAQMYFGNITNAENANRKFQTMILKSKLGSCRSSTLHSKMDDQMQASIIADFISGKIKVLFLVNMLQEGFSLKPLSLAFDCTFRSDWNDSSISRLIQRVGRLMRTNVSKIETSKYYFFRDIFDYLASTPEMPTVNDSMASDDNEIDVSNSELFAAEVAATADNQETAADDPSQQDKTIEMYPATTESLDVSAILGAEEVDAEEVEEVEEVDGEEAEEVDGEVDNADIADKITTNKNNKIKITLVSSPLWVLKNLRGHSEKRIIPYSSLFFIAPDVVEQQKKTLLIMAKNADSRPSQNEKIGRSLSKYTTSTSQSFDLNFNEEIRQLAPHWFENTANTKRKILLEMARNGEPRPSGKALGRELIHYTSSSSATFNFDFNKEIRELAPKWFENTANTKKKILLEMAKNGEPRPPKRGKSGLSSYTAPASKLFDADFYNEIRELSPHWFENTADAKRYTFIEMAKRGDPRPKDKALSAYTNSSSNCFNHDFDKEIRELAPHWFANTADAKRKILIAMAKRGDPRPSKITLYGAALSGYTVGTSRNPAFDKKIRKIAPHWFENSADIKKKNMLEMARNGEPCPNKKRSCLSSYTSAASKLFDFDFNKEIRELAPHWFENTADIQKNILLEMAKNGKERPTKNTKIGASLSRYTRISGRFDENFTNELLVLSPHWFENRSVEA